MYVVRPTSSPTERTIRMKWNFGQIHTFCDDIWSILRTVHKPLLSYYSTDTIYIQILEDICLNRWSNTLLDCKNEVWIRGIVWCTHGRYDSYQFDQCLYDPSKTIIDQHYYHNNNHNYIIKNDIGGCVRKITDPSVFITLGTTTIIHNNIVITTYGRWWCRTCPWWWILWR